MVLARQSSVLSARKFLILESARLRRRIFRFVNNLHRKTTVRASLIWSPSSSKKGGRYGSRLPLGMVRGSLSRNGEGGVCWVGLPIEVEFPLHASHLRVIYNCEIYNKQNCDDELLSIRILRCVLLGNGNAV